MQPPRPIECDFNAFGLSDEPDDTCYYSFDRTRIAELAALIGEKVVLFSPDSATEVSACEAMIEAYREGWRGEPGKSFRFCGVRARPVEGSWFAGCAAWIERPNAPATPSAADELQG